MQLRSAVVEKSLSGIHKLMQGGSSYVSTANVHQKRLSLKSTITLGQRAQWQRLDFYSVPTVCDACDA